MANFPRVEVRRNFLQGFKLVVWPAIAFSNFKEIQRKSTVYHKKSSGLFRIYIYDLAKIGNAITKIGNAITKIGNAIV